VIVMSMNGDDLAMGTSVGWDLARPRLKRLAREFSAYLDKGETLLTPVAVCTQGGQTVLMTGLGVFALAAAMVEVISNRIGEPGPVNAAFTAAAALALALVPLGWIVAHKHAVALTDRRLVVFGWSGMLIGHIQDVFIAMPRSEVSTNFKRRLGWGGLRVEFAPWTGMAPIQLDFWSVDAQIACGIHHALADAAAQAQGITG
jgi:hypothetical protein